MSDQQPVLDFLPDSPLKDCPMVQLPLSALPADDVLLCPPVTLAFENGVRLFGILTPIWVKDTGGGYEVVAGRRRIKAARRCQMTEIPALLLPDDFDTSALTLIENRHRSANPLADMDAVKNLMERGYTDVQIGRALYIGLPVVRKMLTLAALPEPVYEAVKNGKVALGVAEKFARLTERQQDAILKSERVEDITERVVHDARTVELHEAVAVLPDLDVPEEDIQVSLPATLGERIVDAATYDGVSPRDWILRLIERELARPAPLDQPRLRKSKRRTDVTEKE